MVVILNVFRRANPQRINERFRRLQVLSAAFMAFSHGSNDAQKTMGIMTLALIAAGALPADAEHSALGHRACGVGDLPWNGGRRLADHPDDGPAGREARPGPRLRRRDDGGHDHLHARRTSGCRSRRPTSSPARSSGVGSSDRLSAVRWGVAGNIVIAWILTIPASAAVAAVAYLVLSPIL